MSRKVTKQAISAFISGTPGTFDNTTTDGQTLYLFGNKIAEKRKDGLYITNAGWKTATTKERLNALPGVSIEQKAGQWFLNGELWDGNFIRVN